jgi:two-component system, OmpR family, copper resistance phosphate regulon response regulator CusR
MSRILVVEDEARLASILRRGLEAEGYVVEIAEDGFEGEMLAEESSFDAMIVDWRLPRQDGKTLIEHHRASGKTTPILMLTALDDVEHRVAGLDAGADDYLTKPFSFEELLARVRALMRRPSNLERSRVLQAGSLTMNLEKREVHWRDEFLVLRPKEFALLELLLRNRDSVVSRSTIAEEVWGSVVYVTDNVIDVTISSLRHKFGKHNPDEPGAIVLETARGVGYRLRGVDEED